MTSPPPNQSTGRRTVTLIGFTLFGVALGAVGLLGLLTSAGAVGDGAEPSMSRPTSSSPEPASSEATPTPGLSALDVLEMHLPQAVQGHCESADVHGAVARRFAYAAVTCDVGGGLTVEYASFHDAQALRTWFANEMMEADVSEMHTASACRDTGSAGGSGPFWMEATRGNHGAAPHQLQRGRMVSATHGMLMCFTQDQNQVFEWYDSDTHIYGWLEGSSDNPGRVFTWWKRRAGPDHPPMGQMGMSSSSPTPESSTSPSMNEGDMG
jgi:hypothetical protein